jgi:hypothetical protein
MSNDNLIKVCGDPHCDAVYHNCSKKDTKCLDCGGSIKMINESTYLKSFSVNWFQYDRKTGKYQRELTSKTTK